MVDFKNIVERILDLGNILKTDTLSCYNGVICGMKENTVFRVYQSPVEDTVKSVIMNKCITLSEWRERLKYLCEGDLAIRPEAFPYDNNISNITNAFNILNECNPTPSYIENLTRESSFFKLLEANRHETNQIFLPIMNKYLIPVHAKIFKFVTKDEVSLSIYDYTENKFIVKLSATRAVNKSTTLFYDTYILCLR